MGQGTLQRRLQFLRLGDALAECAQRPRHAGVVAAQRDADLMAFEALVQSLAAGAETFIVEDHR